MSQSAIRNSVRALLFQFLFACSVRAQASARAAPGDSTGTLVGTLVDGARVVPWAIVVVKGTPIQDQTTAEGTFRLADVPAGPVVLRVRRLRRADFTQRASVRAGQVDTVVLRVPQPYVERECPTPTEGCVSHDARQRKRLGAPCEVHPWVALAADTVRVVSPALFPTEAFKVAQRDSFPNALFLWEERQHTMMGGASAPRDPFGSGAGRSRGWASGRTPAPSGMYWMEVAFCSECRAARVRFRHR